VVRHFLTFEIIRVFYFLVYNPDGSSVVRNGLVDPHGRPANSQRCRGLRHCIQRCIRVQASVSYQLTINMLKNFPAAGDLYLGYTLLRCVLILFPPSFPSDETHPYIYQPLDHAPDYPCERGFPFHRHELGLQLRRGRDDPLFAGCDPVEAVFHAWILLCM